MHAHQDNLPDLAQELRPAWRKCPHPLMSPCAGSMILRDIFRAGSSWGASSTKVLYLHHLNLERHCPHSHSGMCLHFRIVIVDFRLKWHEKNTAGTIKRDSSFDILFSFFFFLLQVPIQAWCWFLITWWKMIALDLFWSSLSQRPRLQSLTSFPTVKGLTLRLQNTAWHLCFPDLVWIVWPQSKALAQPTEPGWTLQPQTRARVPYGVIGSTLGLRSKVSTPM